MIHTALQILVVLFFFGLCVFIHELGHLLVAMWRGMHVEKFSVGFGPALWKWRWRDIDWQVACIPFGGFVALPQLEPGDQPQSSDGKPLPHVRPLDRILTAAAGPFFNIVLGFILCTIMWQAGVVGFPYTDNIVVQEVDETFVDPKDGVEKATPEAGAGLQAGDEIVAINGQSFSRGWAQAQQMIIFARHGRVQLDVNRDGKRLALPPYQIAANPDVDGIGFPFFSPLLPNTASVVLKRIPLSWRKGAETVPAPAALAGLRPYDTIVSINGEEPVGVEALVGRIQALGEQGTTVAMVVERDGQRLELPTMTPVRVTRQLENDAGTVEEVVRYQLGFHPDNRLLVHPTPWEQMWSVVSMTKRTIARLPDRHNPIKARNMSGPVGILTAMYVSFRDSWRSGLRLVAIISISLAIVNLLPLPVVDGGHCVWGLYELVTRRRVPPKLAIGLSYVFVALILGFFIYVTVEDSKRLYNDYRIPVKDKPAAAPAEPAAAPVPEEPADGTLQKVETEPATPTEAK